MGGWIWGAIGGGLVLVEIMAPGYFLVFPAFGCLCVAIGVIAGVTSIEAQLGLFVAASAVVFAVSARSYRRLLRGGTPSLVNNPRRLVGERGTVEDALTAGQGKVRLGGTVWLARGPDLPKGSPIRVVQVEGTVLVVEAQ